MTLPLPPGTANTTPTGSEFDAEQAANVAATSITSWDRKDLNPAQRGKNPLHHHQCFDPIDRPSFPFDD